MWWSPELIPVNVQKIQQAVFVKVRCCHRFIYKSTSPKVYKLLTYADVLNTDLKFDPLHILIT